MIAFGSDNPFSRNKNLILQIILIILSFNCSMFFFVTVANGLGKYVFRFLIMLISTPPTRTKASRKLVEDIPTYSFGAN